MPAEPAPTPMPAEAPGRENHDPTRGTSATSEARPQEPTPETLSTADLLGLLREDRLWLLRQIDGGRWPDWRLDLAALERELGQLLRPLIAERPLCP